MAQIFAHPDSRIARSSLARIRAGGSERRFFVGRHHFDIGPTVVIGGAIDPVVVREALPPLLQHFRWQQQLRGHRADEYETEEEPVQPRRPARPPAAVVATVVEEGHRPPHEGAALEYRPEQPHQFPRLRFGVPRFFAAAPRRRRGRRRRRVRRRPEEGLGPRCVLQDQSALGRPQRGRAAPEDGAPCHHEPSGPNYATAPAAAADIAVAPIPSPSSSAQEVYQRRQDQRGVPQDAAEHGPSASPLVHRAGTDEARRRECRVNRRDRVRRQLRAVGRRRVELHSRVRREDPEEDHAEGGRLGAGGAVPGRGPREEEGVDVRLHACDFVLRRRPVGWAGSLKSNTTSLFHLGFVD